MRVNFTLGTDNLDFNWLHSKLVCGRGMNGGELILLVQRELLSPPFMTLRIYL